MARSWFAPESGFVKTRNHASILLPDGAIGDWRDVEGLASNFAFRTQATAPALAEGESALRPSARRPGKTAPDTGKRRTPGPPPLFRFAGTRLPLIGEPK